MIRFYDKYDTFITINKHNKVTFFLTLIDKTYNL
jgi:hypothetical protein